MSGTGGNLMAAVQALKAGGNFADVNELIPYTAFVGLEATVLGGDVVTILRRRPTNIGNTQIPAVHGGVLGALLEHAAILQLLCSMNLRAPPRIINLSVDYLRPCLDQDTYARSAIIRQGRRIANVRTHAWQTNPERPIAAAHAHFLLS